MDRDTAGPAPGDGQDQEQGLPAPAATPISGGSPPPVVLVPVSAEDFARRRRILIGSILLAVAVVAGITAFIYKRKVDPIRARETFQTAERLYRIGRFEQAILEFSYAISLDSSIVDAYLLRGRSKVDLTRETEALEDFGKVIELRPNDTIGYTDRAAAYMALKKYDLAIEDCTKAIDLNPKRRVAYNLRGVAHRARNEMDQALADMNRAVEFDPALNHYFERAATLQTLERHREALDDLNKVVEIAPLNAPAYHARARSYRALGQIQSADRDHLYGRYLDSR